MAFDANVMDWIPRSLAFWKFPGKSISCGPCTLSPSRLGEFHNWLCSTNAFPASPRSGAADDQRHHGSPFGSIVKSWPKTQLWSWILPGKIISLHFYLSFPSTIMPNLGDEMDRQIIEKDFCWKEHSISHRQTKYVWLSGNSYILMGSKKWSFPIYTPFSKLLMPCFAGDVISAMPL